MMMMKPTTKTSLHTLPAQFWQQITIKNKEIDDDAVENDTTTPSHRMMVGTAVKEDESVVDGIDQEAEARRQEEEDAAREKGLTCRSVCGDLVFASVEEQQAHFKSDWHLFNLQRKLVGQPRIDEATFNALRDQIATSTSHEGEEGSEDEDNERMNDDDEGESSEEDEAGVDGRNNGAKGQGRARGPRIRLTTNDGRVIHFWRAILPSRQFEDSYRGLTASQEERSPELLESVRGLSGSQKWIFLMCSGGYFAGAVYDGNRVVAHKTFRRYTVRRKQGGSQSARDAKGNKPRSAGAFMRRYHEAQLQREIKELLAEWKGYFDASDLVFYYLPGGGINRSLFFYEGSPLGTKKGKGRGANPKLRSIPFHIERPSVTAIQRAFEILSTIEIENEAQDQPPTRTEADTSRARSEHINEEDQKQQPRRPLATSQERDEEARVEEERQVEAEVIAAVRANDVRTIDEIFNRITDSDLLVGAGSSDFTPLYVACELANMEMVKLLLDKGQNLNVRIPGYHYWTVLHRASADGNIKLIKLLLTRGADPTIKGTISKTPYDVAPNKETRHAFRRFAGDNPDMWDYGEARIPPLTKEMETEVRKKELDKKKKRKEAQKARKIQEKEEEEARKKHQEERRRAKKERERQRKLEYQQQREREEREKQEELERRRKQEEENDEELQRAIQLSLGIYLPADSAPSTTPSASADPTSVPGSISTSSPSSQTTSKPSAESVRTTSTTSKVTASSSSSSSGPATSGVDATNRSQHSGVVCDFCRKRMGEKTVPFHRLSFKYCSTKCVQEHRKQLGK